MKIRKALKKAMAAHCPLARKAWNRDDGPLLCVVPAAGIAGNVQLQVWLRGQVKASGWQPEAGDLLATDWYLVEK